MMDLTPFTKTFSVLVFPILLLATPPKSIPFELYYDYTMGGRIPVYDWYFDNSYSPENPIVFQADEINLLMSRAKERHESYYGATDRYLYAILDQFEWTQKKVAIIGSVTPWYESILLTYGAHPVTIEYNKIFCDDPRLTVMTVSEYWENPQKFDAVISISSIEHDGLGRYGDPINPRGDLDAMQAIKKMLKPGGILILAIPVGEDAIYWNAHRIYGRIRLPLLFDEWDLIDSAGFFDSDLSQTEYSGHQPIFVLRPL